MHFLSGFFSPSIKMGDFSFSFVKAGVKLNKNDPKTISSPVFTDEEHLGKNILGEKNSPDKKKKKKITCHRWKTKLGKWITEKKKRTYLACILETRFNYRIFPLLTWPTSVWLVFDVQSNSTHNFHWSNCVFVCFFLSFYICITASTSLFLQIWYVASCFSFLLPILHP